LVAIAILSMQRLASAQSSADPFGSQPRADAASNLIRVGVQQAISSLPPSSAQTFLYEFDFVLGTFTLDDSLGPIVLRSPATIGEGQLAIRFAGSYFDLERDFAPIGYRLEAEGITAFTRFGLEVEARIGVLNFGASYGVTDRVEVTLALPVTIVDAAATQSFPSPKEFSDFPPDEAPVAFSASLAEVDANLEPDGLDFLRTDSFDAAGFDFNEGTSVGLGRVEISGKALLVTEKGFDLSGGLGLFLPSPSSEEFAGPDSFSVLPRLVGGYGVTEYAHVLADIGYEYDVDFTTLRRLTWDAGLWLGSERASVDVGFGGSHYETGIDWTPPTFVGEPVRGGFPGGTFFALEETDAGSDFVDFLLGGKFQLGESAAIGGSVVVPVTDDGLRADAIGTLVVEYYF
jgi:hypothetical protein